MTQSFVELLEKMFFPGVSKDTVRTTGPHDFQVTHLTGNPDSEIGKKILVSGEAADCRLQIECGIGWYNRMQRFIDDSFRHGVQDDSISRNGAAGGKIGIPGARVTHQPRPDPVLLISHLHEMLALRQKVSKE
ncbi:MAG: hypothetical protein ABF727_13235 [Gluconobacter oxydans]